MKNLLKKFNWGWGIGIFYSGFVLFMLCMVYKASQQSVELVSSDYYNKELTYQEHIDKVNRTKLLKEQPALQVNKRSVQLKFPSTTSNQNVKADVLFYRPSDSQKDFSVKLVSDSTGNANVASDKFSPGVYLMQVNWDAGQESYYNEWVVHIN
jgi:hypothetical protein